MNWRKALTVVTIIFFILINSSYYWEGVLGGWATVAGLILSLLFLTLTAALLVYIIRAIREKLKDRTRLVLISVMLIALVLTVMKPEGVVDFEKLEGKDLLIAGRTGVASCHITLKLKANNKVLFREVCFGIDSQLGSYSISEDTVKFHFIGRNTFEYGIIRMSNDSHAKYDGEITLYKNKADTTPMFLAIFKNNLSKK